MRRLRVTLTLLLALACEAWAQAPVVEARVYLQSSRLAGFRYHEGRKLWPQMQVGDALSLAREPDNPHDANAVRVEWRGRMIGYMPRMENAALARYMDHGQRLDGRITRLPRERRRGRGIEFDIYLEK